MTRQRLPNRRPCVTFDQKVNNIHSLFRHTMEEIGEVATALSVQAGDKFKSLTEDSKSEAVDLLLCVASLWFETEVDAEYDWLKLSPSAVFQNLSTEIALARIGEFVCKGYVTSYYLKHSPPAIPTSFSHRQAADSYRSAVEYTINLCFNLGCTAEDIIAVGEVKLNKWLGSVRRKASLATSEG